MNNNYTAVHIKCEWHSKSEFFAAPNGTGLAHEDTLGKQKLSWYFVRQLKPRICHFYSDYSNVNLFEKLHI